MMWHWFNWGFGGFWWIMTLIMIVFWGLIVWVIVALVRGATRHGCCSSSEIPSESALEILKRRYAKGEITRDEFEERKQTLG